MATKLEQSLMDNYLNATYPALPVETTDSMQATPRNKYQDALGAIATGIQTGAEAIDFNIIGFPNVGYLTLKDLTVGDLGKVLEKISYGEYPVEGAGGIAGTSKLNMEDTLELLNAVPIVGATRKLAIKGGMKVGKKIMEKTGKAVAENK
jgi:hypothetical protein